MHDAAVVPGLVDGEFGLVLQQRDPGARHGGEQAPRDSHPDDPAAHDGAAWLPTSRRFV
jgi:hypothetical protein